MRDRVHRALADRFGANSIFKSGQSIPPGADFAEVLRRQAAECELMFVLIGPGWIDARDEDGRRLIDREHDWVRLEIATALRAGNRVVPVLLGDGVMLPHAAELPEDISVLPGLQFLRVPETHLADGLDRFGEAVSELLADPGHGPSREPAAVPAAAEPGSTAAGPDIPSPPDPADAPVTMTAHVSGGGSAYQAARDLTIRPAEG